MDAQLRAAISVGAPLYNAGDVAGCATAYRVTAQQLLTANDLAPVAAARLRAALQEADAAKNDDAAAWALRHAFDALLSSAPPATLLEFRGTLPAGVTFTPAHDTVMGGASSGELVYDAARGTAVFSGVVSTANGGGFASFRSSACLWPAAAAGVLVVVAAGDGLQREYKCICRTDDASSYQAIFVAGPDAVAETHRLPFTAFRYDLCARVCSHQRSDFRVTALLSEAGMCLVLHSYVAARCVA